MRDFWYKLFNAPTAVFSYDPSDPEDRKSFEITKKTFKKALNDSRRYILEFDDKSGVIRVWRKEPY